MGNKETLLRVKEEVDKASRDIKANRPGGNKTEACRLLYNAGEALKIDKFNEAIEFAIRAQKAAWGGDKNDDGIIEGRLHLQINNVIDILRGYTVLSNNDIKLGIRLINNKNFVIMDAEVILDYTKSLFSMNDSQIQHVGNITPKNSRTATFILKPLACIHNEQINALITYKDHKGNKQTLHMRPKEVHCVCPFLKEKPMSEGEYSRLAGNSEFIQEGISFKGISVDELANFMGETCRHMLYKIKGYDFNGKKIIYLAGESLGEKTYYLLTVVVQEYKGLTQVVLRAHSDKKYGLNGFMNEMAGSIRHLVGSVQDSKEIGIIENNQIINIIDSVVQRTNFEMGAGGNTQVNIKDSVVQRSKIGKE